MIKQIANLLTFLPLISFSQTFSEEEIKSFEKQANKVTIIRDDWGVPHIYGKKDADAVFGLMYVQCEENFSQVEENHIEMLGRMSEVFGESFLYQDLQMQLIYDTADAIADYKNAEPWLRSLLDAAAAGVNFYLYKHPDAKPKLLNRFEPWFALMRTDGSIGATQTGGLTIRDMKELYPVKDNGTSYFDKPEPFFEMLPTGSNGFAIAPSRSATDNALLYINPHTTFYYRTEVHIVSEEGLNAYGAVTWGTFFIYQGFNEYCGWMHTSSYADVADLYEEKIFTNELVFTYEYDKKPIPFDRKEIIIRYKKGDSLLQYQFPVVSTLHGPVMGSRNGKLLSLKEYNRSKESLAQSWIRTKSKGFGDYKKAMDIRANNSNNTVFADNKGNIAYWHGNFMPKRDTKYDYSLPVDGSISATNWKGVHPVNETVHLYNPASGWIQNCNSTPFTAAGESSPEEDDYPLYMAPDGQNYRALNAMKLLSGSEKLSMESLISNIGYSHYLSAFDVLLPPLINAFEQLPPDDSIRAELAEAVRLLMVWDLNSSASSIATTLAIEWAQKMSRHATPVSNPYHRTHATSQVNSMVSNTSDDKKLKLLQETLYDLEKRFGTWKLAWGDINRYQRSVSNNFDDAKWSIPVGLAPGTWGALPSYQSRTFSGTNKRYGTSGNSFIACVEFGKKLKAKTIITGGQSFDPSSAHHTDQASMFINGIFKDVRFYKEDVMKYAVRNYKPGEE